MSEELVEKRLRELETELAVLRANTDKQEEEIKGLKGGISRGLWIIGGGFMTAFISWVMAGGLTNVK